MTRPIIAALSGILLVAAVIAVLIGAKVISLGDEDTETNANSDTIALGESIYEQQCAGCHSIDGSNSVGPTFQGLYGSEVAMEDGTTVVVDDDYIIESVIEPRAKVREDYPAIMPSFGDLSEDELAGIVAFIQSLE